MTDFSMEMRKWVESTISAVESEAEDIAIEAVRSLIELSPHPSGADGRPSPYSKGDFVNNWNVGSQVSVSYNPSPAPSKEGKIAELSDKIKGHFDTNTTLFIWNSGPYVAQVEYLGWTVSNEYAPIRRTVDKLKARSK